MINRKFGLGVLICVFNRDFSKILLLKRNKEKREKCKADWGNIGGRIEFGETIIESCIREAREEIGVNLNPENLKLIEIKETPYLSDIFHAIHFVHAIIIDEDEKITINKESEAYEWFNLDNLPDKTFDSKEYIIKLNTLTKREFQ